MKKITQFLLMTCALVFSTAVMSQSTITGTVIDSNLNAPLPGANVVEQGTTNGVSTDFDGKFTLTTDANSGQIVISYVGYASITLDFNGNTDFGDITLLTDSTLDEIVVVGTGIIDLAEDRKTPVAVSTIRASEIQNKIGTQDITMTLVNTPSVYVSGASGGFGDTRIAVRGFEQDNTAFLINGQPINSMEDGRMFWSNWSGMNDIASAVQIQRGLGASKLAISSVGGTVNFVTKTTAKREGGFVYAGIANDNYLKTTYQYSTGVSDKGWGTTFMISHWQGDGYNEGNFGEGQTYFWSVGYTPNDTHNFNFLITGAPQFHDQNFSKPISDYLTYGRKYNNNWGTYQGQYLTERRNFYHKPVANLNWDYTINDNSSLSTVLYASWGRGGGTGNRGVRQRTDEGRIDYEAIYVQNSQVPDRAGVYFGSDPAYITRSSMNLHSWYGLVSNLNTQLNENLSLNVGFDLRTYFGEHFRIVENFHGLNSWRENIRLRDQNNNHDTFGGFGEYKFVETTRDLSANPWAALFASFDQDEKIAYSNDERITYGGLFTQLEYAKDDLSLFIQAAISSQKHVRWDHFQYADDSLLDGTSSQWTGEPLPAGITDGVKSESVTNTGFNIKGGGSYAFDEDNQVYVNAGYYSRQPYHDNIYLNFTNFVNPLTENEKVLGLEAGYTFQVPDFSANINLYRTSWKDRVVTSTDVDDDVVTFETNYGVEQVHSGVELDFTWRQSANLRFKGFMSIGNWEFKGKGITRISDEEQNVLDTFEEDFDGGKVGDAAQFMAGLGADLRIVETMSGHKLTMDADYRAYNKLYADVGAIKDNLELPAYDLVDMGVSYRMPLKQNEKSLNIRFNINNLFNEIYLSELSSAISAGAGAETYKGVNVANRGYFGLGRTWNVSLRYKF